MKVKGKNGNRVRIEMKAKMINDSKTKLKKGNDKWEVSFMSMRVN